MSDADAAGFYIAYITGWIGLVTRGQMQRGERLAVLGAAGGCGSAAVQLATALGGHVIAVVGGRREGRVLPGRRRRDVDHHTEDVPDRCRAITGGRGVDLIYDPVGGTAATDTFAGISSEGRMLGVGFASGESTHPTRRDVLRPNCSIVGVFTGAYDRAALEGVFARLGELVQHGGIGAGSSTITRFDDLPVALDRWPGATQWERSSSSPEPVEPGSLHCERAPGRVSRQNGPDMPPDRTRGTTKCPTSPAISDS